MRARFNADRFVQRAAEGNLRQEVELDLPLPPWKCKKYGLPIDSRSQRIAYFDGAVCVAKAHQFVRPDGTIGASGMPDPKEMLVNGELWIV